MSVAQSNPTVRGKLSRNEPMARHTSWRTGGAAERYFEPADVDDLCDYLRQLDDGEALTWIGLGSNILVRDGGIPGTVISTAHSLNKLRWLDANELAVDCGTPCAKVAKEAEKRQLRGGSFLAGIPGTIGGALAMNAGAFGRDIWSLVESVELLDRNGLVHRHGRDDFNASYRDVAFPTPRDPTTHWFVHAVLRFDVEGAEETPVRELLALRAAAQPTGKASCGSVFKNPTGDFAGRLVEAAGLKGRRIGGCHVSNKHANFIINDAAATASDIETLIAEIQQTVVQKFGVSLEPEVRVIGVAFESMGGEVVQ